MKYLFFPILPILLAFFPFKLFWLSFILFIPLLSVALDEKGNFKTTFLCSLGYGICYFATAFYWLTQTNLKIYFLVLAILIWIYPLFFCAVYFFQKQFQKWQLILLSLGLWWGMNLLMQQTPLNAHAMDYPFLTAPLSALQMARWSGIVGWELLLIGFQIATVLLWRSQKRRAYLGPLFLFVAFIVGSFAYGTKELQASSEAVKPQIALIQHNLPMSPDWRIKNQAETKSIYAELAKNAEAQNPELLVFPLYTLPEDHFRNPEFFSNLAREVSKPILMAAHVPVEAGGDVFGADYHTMAILFSKEGRVIGKYEAVQKAPEFVKSKEATAEEYVILETPVGKVGLLLCFEDSVRRYAKEAKVQGAEFLLALSNPGHFVDTKMPRIYLIHDQLRAIESGLPLLRLSVNGLSAVLDSKGRVLKQSRLNQREILYSKGS